MARNSAFALWLVALLVTCFCVEANAFKNKNDGIKDYINAKIVEDVGRGFGSIGKGPGLKSRGIGGLPGVAGNIGNPLFGVPGLPKFGGNPLGVGGIPSLGGGPLGGLLNNKNKGLGGAIGNGIGGVRGGPGGVGGLLATAAVLNAAKKFPGAGGNIGPGINGIANLGPKGLGGLGLKSRGIGGLPGVAGNIGNPLFGVPGLPKFGGNPLGGGGIPSLGGGPLGGLLNNKNKGFGSSINGGFHPLGGGLGSKH